MNLRAMYLRTHALALLVAVAGALAVAGCGHKQGAPIPAANANDIIGRLQEAQRRSDSRACHDLRTDTLPVLQQQVSGLPQNVDSNVRATLQDGVAHLKDLVEHQCAAQQTQTTTTPTSTTPTIPTQTTPTQTTPTQTATTPRTTTTPHTTTTSTTTTPTTPHTTPGPTPPGPPGQGGVTPPGQAKKGKGH